jgi:Domain of unknown function (DUF1707)
MAGQNEWTSTGRGRLRAAHADRDRVVFALKAAFVQGRLDKDELDARVGQALASRTYAELAALTADLPAGPADVPAGPVAAAGTAPAKPSHTPAQTLAIASKRAAISLLLSVALLEATFLTGFGGYLAFAIFAFIGFQVFLGYGVVDAWNERRASRRLPVAGQRGPDGRDGGPELEGRQPGRTDLGPSGVDADQNRAELSNRQAGQYPRRIPAMRGIGPVPNPA